jgi:adenylate cyclase
MNLKSFLAELRRRHVYRVAIAYAVVGWLLIQVATQVFPFLQIPDWVVRAVIALVVIGFPIALIIAWAVELTPDGVRWTGPTSASPDASDAEGGDATQPTGQSATPKPDARLPSTQASTGVSRPPGAIAVLPLENVSGRPEEEYFADGMTEALITDLAKAGLKVISRGSVIGFKGTRQPLRDIGRVLGVDSIVEGSVLRSGDRVRVSARLVRAETDEYLWTERYDRELADVLMLQDEVARAVAHAVDQTLHAGTALPQRKIDPEVYLLELRGRHLWHQRTERGFRAALGEFEAAAALDPAYAPAYAGIAESLNMLANFGFVAPREILPRATAAVKRAIELDPASADAHRIMAFVHWQFEFNWQAAIAEYERSLELAPHSPTTTYWFGAYLAVIGYFERANELLNRAHEYDPLSLIGPSVQGWSRVFARRFEEALPFLDGVLRIDPDFHLALWFRGEALTELKRYDEGIASLQRAYELSGQSSRMLGYLGNALGRSGQMDRARGCLAELRAREGRGDYVPPYFPALILAGLGSTNEAIECLETAYRDGDTMLRDLKADPQWDAMRPLPRFAELMRRMAYPETGPGR